MPSAKTEIVGRKEMSMKRIAASILMIGLAVVLVAGCGVSTGKSGDDKAGEAYAPDIDPADFSTKIDNEYFPMKPGTTFVYEGRTKEGTERNQVTVTHDTRRVMGVECVVVRDKVFLNGGLIEDTFDWYAQDKKGNVWYFGENTKEYENGKVSTEGSWEAGKVGAKPGIIMLAHPKVGQTYRQEYKKGSAEDMAKVLDLNGSVKVSYGSFHPAVVTKEWSPLETGVVAHKYYGAGAGDVKEVAVKGPLETLVLVDVSSNG